MKRSTKAPPCPRCKSADTKPLTNYGRPVNGRYQCLACNRWFGPNNPPDAGGTGEEERTSACRTCGKPLKIIGGGDKSRTLPAHKCPHGAQCSDRALVSACPACSAVLDVKPEILAPPCVWCAPLDAPEGAQGKGCARCQSGTLAADHRLLRELRDTTAGVF